MVLDEQIAEILGHLPTDEASPFFFRRTELRREALRAVESQSVARSRRAMEKLRRLHRRLVAKGGGPGPSQDGVYAAVIELEVKYAGQVVPPTVREIRRLVANGNLTTLAREYSRLWRELLHWHLLQNTPIPDGVVPAISALHSALRGW